jgi:methionine-rich copper-binding protein CopC
MTQSGLIAALACAFVTHTAFAHAYPKTETPPANSTVQTAPSEVAIEFDDELEPKFSSIVVQDAKGTRVDDGKPHGAPDDPKHLAVGVNRLPPAPTRRSGARRTPTPTRPKAATASP